MAECLPGAEFVGVDLSAKQIGDGKQMVDALGLKNVDLRHLDILAADTKLGQFDYILCHGVYSWVPEPVQRKILEICRDRLNDNGVAYVSYNTLPGWRMRGMIRDMMMFHTQKFSDERERIQQARALLAFLNEANGPKANDAYSVHLRSELQFLSRQADSYLFHEHLEENNEPLYFHQFVERAAQCDLAYLGDADPATMWSGAFSDSVREKLDEVKSDALQTEQYMDFLRNRMFRQTLLCRQGASIDRTLQPERVVDLFVAANVSPVGNTEVDETGDASIEYRGAPAITLSTSAPLMKAGLSILRERYPQSMQVSELARAARARLAQANADFKQPHPGDAQFLAEHLSRCFLSNLAEFTVRPYDFVTEVSDQPSVSPVARHQAKSHPRVTNRRHEASQPDPFTRFVIARLDGSMSPDALFEGSHGRHT